MKISTFWLPIFLTLSACVYGQMEDDTSTSSTGRASSDYCDDVLYMICYECAPSICDEVRVYIRESNPSDAQCEDIYRDYC